MLRGDKIALRARHEADVAVLQAELYEDVATRSRADSRPWRPIPPGNAAMIWAATRAGFRLEGTLRSSTWVLGAFEDEAVFGLLAAEWPVAGV